MTAFRIGLGLGLLLTTLNPSAAQAPDPERLRREHARLEGAWTISSFVDDGESLGPEIVRDRIARDGRITFARRSVSMTNPRTGATRSWDFRLDPSKLPKQITLVSENYQEIPGIYQFDGDELTVCLTESGGSGAPANFDAPAGSGSMLLKLSVVNSGAVKREQSAEEAQALARSRDQERQAALDRATAREASNRKRLVGTWVHNDNQGSITTVLRDDGTFVSTRVWSQPLKKMFRDTTTRGGSWNFDRNTLTIVISSSQLRGDLNRSYVGRLESIDDRAAVFTDSLGRLDRFARVQ